MNQETEANSNYYGAIKALLVYLSKNAITMKAFAEKAGIAHEFISLAKNGKHSKTSGQFRGFITHCYTKNLFGKVMDGEVNATTENYDYIPKREAKPVKVRKQRVKILKVAEPIKQELKPDHNENWYAENEKNIKASIDSCQSKQKTDDPVIEKKEMTVGEWIDLMEKNGKRVKIMVEVV